MLLPNNLSYAFHIRQLFFNLTLSIRLFCVMHIVWYCFIITHADRHSHTATMSVGIGGDLSPQLEGILRVWGMGDPSEVQEIWTPLDYYLSSLTG